MEGGRLRELVAHTGSSIVTTCTLTVFFALVSMVNWIFQTYKCIIILDFPNL